MLNTSEPAVRSAIVWRYVQNRYSVTFKLLDPLQLLELIGFAGVQITTGGMNFCVD